MGEPVISADRDDSVPTNIWKKQTPGNTEIWHIPREFEPDKPLCGAKLAGKFKRTKGTANCTSCRGAAAIIHIYGYYHPVLRALYLNEPIPPYPNHYTDHSTLYDADLVANKGGRMVLTSRGKLAARDIINPVGWYDPQSQLYHARRALELSTLCTLSCRTSVGAAHSALEHIEELHDLARKHPRDTITCVRCAIHVDRRDHLD